MGIKYSKNGIIKYVEHLLKNESRTNTIEFGKATLWEEQLRIQGLVCYIKKGGSQIDKTQPYVRNDVWFPRKQQMEKLIDCIYSPHNITKWDTNVVACYKLPGIKATSYGLQYQGFKKQLTMNPRDFVEKYIMFYEKGILYRFCVSVPEKYNKALNDDISEVYRQQIPPEDPNITRIFTNIHVAMCYRNQENGKIIYQSLT